MWDLIAINCPLFYKLMHSSTIILSSLTHFENENQAKGTQIPLRLGKLKKKTKNKICMEIWVELGILQRIL